MGTGLVLLGISPFAYAAGGSVTVGVAIPAGSALNVNTGIFNANALAMSVAGNWINSSTFTHGNNTVTFDGTGAQTATNGLSNS